MLPRCLNSLFAQTWRDFKAIVVDNASEDSTGDIARRAGEQDSRFCCIYCGTQGVSSARNTGLEEADTPYIVFLDADDELVPDALETLAAFLKTGDMDLVIFNYYHVKNGYPMPVDTATEAGSIVVRGADIPRLIAGKLTTYMQNSVFKCYKTEFLNRNNFRFDPSLSLGEDLLFNIAVYEAANRVGYISRPLYRYHIMEGGLNTRWRSDIVELKTMLNKRLKEYLTDNGVFNNAYYTILLNDIFVILAHNPTRDGIRRVLNSDSVRELLHSGVRWRLSFKKRLFLLCLRLRLITPLWLIIKTGTE